MRFNLIDEKWIPVRRRNGTQEKIAPWQITDKFTDNYVVSLNSVRPDFNGAFIQFLTGLVQTTAAPSGEDEWEDCFESPPSPEALREKFMPVHDAFELFGDGPRFMQDLDKLDVDNKDIFSLLIDAPGDQALKNHADLFVKRESVGSLCPSCCASALFTMQTNAPAGGAGFRVSLRGGGPLSTLVIGDEDHNSLWHLVWLNVLEHDYFLRTCGNPKKNTDADRFPWLAHTRTSEKGTGVSTAPEDAHPAQMFWGMPRRIRLNLDEPERGTCGLCGDDAEMLIRSYQEKNYGTNYVGWLHTLSPYYQGKDGTLLPVHAQPGGVHFRHWLGFVQKNRSDKAMPAQVVHKFRHDRQNSTRQFRLWAFGYDMNKMKARCWYESTMPLLYVDRAFRNDYEDCVASMITAASEIAGNTRTAVKKAWFKRPKDKKGFVTISSIDSVFWHGNEETFYEFLSKLRSSFGDKLSILTAWHKVLCNKALDIYDEFAFEGLIEDADPKRVVDAKKELQQYNRGNKIKEILGLPVEKASKGNRRKSK